MITKRHWIVSYLILSTTLAILLLFIRPNNEQKDLQFSRELANISNKQEMKQESLTNRAPTISIKTDKTCKLNKPLKIEWEISNKNNIPIYLHATRLKMPEIARYNIDIDNKTIEMVFSPLKKHLGCPYSFPDISFIKIEPSSSHKETFIANEPFNRINKSSIIFDHKKMTTGTWTIKWVVSYGYEIDAILRASKAEYPYGSGHPENPLVEWQKIVCSNSTNIDVVN